MVFVMHLYDGGVAVEKGNPPADLMYAAQQIAARMGDGMATVKAVKGAEGVRLWGEGLTEGEIQRLRNVHRLSVQSALRASPNPVNEQNVRKAWSLARLLRMLTRLR